MTETEVFTFCDKIDLYALDYKSDASSISAIMSEHNFRGIVVLPNKIEEYVKNLSGQSKKIISIIDYPFGDLSKDIRSYSIFSAKEKGATEVEVLCPYGLIQNKDIKAITEDIENLTTTAVKADITLRYIFDQGRFIDATMLVKICKALIQNEIKHISTSIGFFDEKIDHSENVIKMRNIKNKINCLIKTLVNTSSVDSFALYPKAGADIIGMNWNIAANVVHAYEEMIISKR